jgi:1,2-diacylglycerol 3-alpha-glucosyltransferase
MKIGILTNTYPPVTNGVSVSVKGLEKALKKSGHQVFIATPKPDQDSFVKDNICYIRSSKLPQEISPDLKVPLFFINQATKFFRDKEIDLIHSHDTIMGGPEATMIALNLGVPAVHTFHTHIELYNYMPFPGYQTFIKNYVREVCNTYQHVITPSKKMYKYLLERGVRVPLSQVYNVPQLAELNAAIKPSVLKRLQDLGISKQDEVVITFSRLGEEKGVHVAIKSLSKFLNQSSRRKFLVAGWGPFKKDLENLVAELNLQDKVIFYGKYDRTDLPSLTSVSKLFVFPSRSENLPTNLFEAMYLGLPAMCVDDDSVDYLVQDKVNGYKTSESEFSDLSSDLITNSTKLKSFSTKAIESAKKLDPKKIADEHLYIYSQVLERFKETEKGSGEGLGIRQTAQKLLDKTYTYLRGKYEGLNDFFDYPSS